MINIVKDKMVHSFKKTYNDSLLSPSWSASLHLATSLFSVFSVGVGVPGFLAKHDLYSLKVMSWSCKSYHLSAVVKYILVVRYTY